jgi:diaminopimelate epimerase
MIRFTKMNGAGNDFVLIDNRSGTVQPSREQIAFWCDRHRGIGADGVLLVESPASNADFRMRYYNRDGGEAEMCGNGARCFARFVNRVAGPFSDVSFETIAGVIHAEFDGDLVKLGMNKPSGIALHRTLEIGEQKLISHFINTGVPHVVVFVDDLEATPVDLWGRHIRYHAAFQPRGTNANFARIIAPGRIAIRTYERGVEAETLACGTGVVASALVYAALHPGGYSVEVSVRGGDTLSVGFRLVGENVFDEVTLKGPADFTFEGEI